MVWDNVSHELANLGLEVVLIVGGLLCLQLFNRLFPRKRDDDDTYVIVDKTGRKITVTVKLDGSPQQQREQAEQLLKELNLGR